MRHILLVTLLSSTSLAAAPQDWAHWRGPAFDGSSEVTGLPTSFDPAKNIRWSTELPGPSAATPIIVGDRIYVTAAVKNEGELRGICVDRESGRILWSHDLHSGYRPGDKGEATWLHNRSNYASPSPVADENQVIFFFGNGDLVALTPEGEPAWRKNLQQAYGDFCFQWTFSASPTLHDGRIYIQILQRDQPVGGIGKADAESFLLALDASNGEEIFRHVRPSPARRESLESYATPIPVSHGDREEILVVGGDVISGHDPASGKEYWRWGTWNPDHREEWWRLVPSPVVGKGMVLACGPKGAPVVAVRLGGEGDLNDEHVAWQKEGRANPVTTDVPTPLFYQDAFFVLSDLRNKLSRLGADGEAAWTIDLPRDWKWRASPTGADGRLWLIDHNGNMIAIDAATGETQFRAELGNEDDDGIRASVAAAHGALFVRTNSSLICIAR